MNAIWIVLPILTLLMFELGLTLRIEDFKLFRQRPRPIIAGLIGQNTVLTGTGIHVGIRIPVGTFILHRNYADCLFSRRKLIQYIFNDS